MRPLLPALFIFLLTLSSCASKEESESSASLVHSIPVDNLEEAKAIVARTTVSCEEPGKCPANVALFTGAQKDKALSCTGFLVGKDLIVTNSHCLPAPVRYDPKACAEHVRFFFPAAEGFPAMSVGCKELLGRSDPVTTFSPDLAVLRLEKELPRPILTIDHRGVKPNTNYTAFKINPIESDGLSGILKIQGCKTITNSYRFPLYRKSSDSIFVAADCPQVHGNSGSPLVNEVGAAVGVLQAELKKFRIDRRTQ